MSKNKFVIGLIILILSLAAFFTLGVKGVKIEGHELGIRENWWSGVVKEPIRPGIHWFCPGFANTVTKYDMSSQIYVMNDVIGDKEYGQGRENDAYKVQSAEGQDMTISLNCRWRPDPSHLVTLHTEVREKFDEKVLRNTLLRVVKDKATIRKAIDAYSGTGLVDLQKDIESDLSNPEGEMRQKGIIIENFVIEKIDLDPAYTAEIKGRQVAVQKELRAKQEQQAALAEADKAQAEAQADLKRQVVGAERDKQVGILNAQKEAETKILTATADQKSAELKAKGIIAIGQAESETKKLLMLAYQGDGADNYVRTEVAKSMAQAFGNFSGYLPSNMSFNVIGQDFLNSVESVMHGNKINKQK